MDSETFDRVRTALATGIAAPPYQPYIPPRAAPTEAPPALEWDEELVVIGVRYLRRLRRGGIG